MKDNPKYRAWIKRKPCMVPGCENTDIHCHHWQTADNHGTAEKPDDSWCVPLCAEHHRTGPLNIHNTGKVTFARRCWPVFLLSGDWPHVVTANKAAVDDYVIRIIRGLLAEYGQVQEEIIADQRATIKQAETFNQWRENGTMNE